MGEMEKWNLNGGFLWTPRRRRRRRIIANLNPDWAYGVNFDGNPSYSSLLSESYDVSVQLPYMYQVFNVGPVIGEGSCGEVFEANSLDDGKDYAIKRIKERFNNAVDREYVLSEVRRHLLVPPHQNCVQLYRAWEQDHQLYMQMELCQMNLLKFLETNGPFTPERTWELVLDILLGLKNLHDNNLIHMDIKLENIYMTPEESCKIGDFGLLLDTSEDLQEDLVDANPQYLSLEALNGVYIPAIDVFSVGICTLQLATGIKLPENGTPWRRLRDLQFPDECQNLPDDLMGIIRQMVDSNYPKRPTVNELLENEKLAELLVQRKMKDMASSMTNGIKQIVNSVSGFTRGVCSEVVGGDEEQNLPSTSGTSTPLLGKRKFVNGNNNNESTDLMACELTAIPKKRMKGKRPETGKPDASRRLFDGDDDDDDDD